MICHYRVLVYTMQFTQLINCQLLLRNWCQDFNKIILFILFGESANVINQSDQILIGWKFVAHNFSDVFLFLICERHNFNIIGLLAPCGSRDNGSREGTPNTRVLPQIYFKPIYPIWGIIIIFGNRSEGSHIEESVLHLNEVPPTSIILYTRRQKNLWYF